MTPHRGNLTLAVAKVKEQLGLTLSKSEQAALDKWATGIAQNVEDNDGELAEVGAASLEE